MEDGGPLRPATCGGLDLLRAIGDPAQLAARAGHSVMVVLGVYAKGVDGAQSESPQKVLDSTRK